MRTGAGRARSLGRALAGLCTRPRAFSSSNSTDREKQKVCLVIGAGAGPSSSSSSSSSSSRPPCDMSDCTGIGGNVARRFARDSYHAVLCRRSDELGLQKMVKQIHHEGGCASGRLFNAVEDGSIEQLVADVEKHVGPIHTAVYNLGAQIGDRKLDHTSLKAFEMGWRLGTLGLFRLASAVLPIMADRGKGSLLVTSATAAVRGSSGQHSHAAAMGGRRMLCQTLNAEFATRGVHVAHILIDGAVDAPDTLGRMLGPERFEQFRAVRGQDGLLAPSSVADTYWHLAHQHRSAWTFECDLRSWSDRPWWN